MPRKTKKTPRVSVVIPSWNSEKQMKQNMPYVYKAAKRVGAEIVIVDDASAYDDSWGFMQQEEQEGRIRAYLNKTNIGFSANVNKGVRLAKGELIMLLNTDVRPSADCFDKALKYFENQSIFAVTFNSGEAWMGGEWNKGLFHHFKVEPTPANQDEVNPSLWASGGQAAFDKKKWTELGGMDVLYKPFYWEDTDLGYSAWLRGWQVIWAPDCKVVHDHQKSVIASNFSKKFVMDTAQRNQFLFIWKNISDSGMLMTHLLYLPYYFLKFPLPLLKALLKLPATLVKRRLQLGRAVRPDREIITQWAR